MSEQEDNESSSPQPQTERSWLPSVPAPIKRVFDRFPLTTYPPNPLPTQSSSRQTDEHILYLFTDACGARNGAPSFNPQCLKWQTYLRLSGPKFRTAPSTNHASPTGALPYLLPANSLTPILSSKFQEWTSSERQPQQQGGDDEDGEADLRCEPYMSLLDHRIRQAWLYALYLHEPNFSVARSLYIDPTTSNTLVRLTLAHQLQRAARTELLKGSTSSSPTSSTISSSYIDFDDILAEASNAFEALSSLLGDDEYFFGTHYPGLFDASVFAYTHLILDTRTIAWKDNILGRSLRRYKNLVNHRERLREQYF